MSIWTRITEALAALTQGEGLSRVFERLRTPPERSVAFTIAVIALGAKMAKADGRVTRDEVTAFREVFEIAPEDERDAARVFNLARQDVAGYEEYAHKIRRMFGSNYEAMVDLLEGLFHIAVADGEYHEAEDAFLQRVADILGVDAPCFRSIKARLVPDAAPDPYTVLKVTPDMPLDQIRQVYRDTVRESHPDRLIARGLPEEAVQMAQARLAAVNDAWEVIQQDRAA